MDTQIGVSTDAPDTTSNEPAVSAELETQTPPAAPLRARVVLVEDIEYFHQTGVLRRVLELRWNR